MSTAFPTALDTFTNPSSNSNMNDSGVVHNVQHTNTNDAIVAIETAIGITGSSDSASLQYKLANKQSAVKFSGAPSTATSAGTVNDIVVASGYLYVCIATNSWVRAAVATW